MAKRLLFVRATRRRARRGQRRRSVRRPARGRARGATLTFSAAGDERADLRAVGRRASTPPASRFTLRSARRASRRRRCRCPGRFNVENALCALGVAVALGVDLGRRGRRARRRRARPGPVRADRRGPALRRARRLRAHARLARERARGRAPDHRPDGRLICVFGCGGDRDRDKRPLMGRDRGAARRPRDRHLRQPALGGSGGDHRRDPSPAWRPGARTIDGRARPRARRSRSRSARAEPGDIVVIAGKGHEQGQEFEGGRKIPFDDREVAREELARSASATARGPRDRARARADRRGGRGRDRRRGRRRPPGAGRDRLARASGRAISSSASPASSADGGRVRRRGARGGRLGRRRRAGPRARSLRRASAPGGWVLAAADPLAALQELARDWRRELGCPVVGITGSTGQDIGQGHHAGRSCRARPREPGELQHRDRPAARRSSRRRAETEVLVLEMAMRGMRPDRRALRDRRARRRRDHQRRPGRTSSCSGRSRRSPRPRPRSSPGSAPTAAPWSRPTPRRSSRTSPTSSRRSPSGPAATSSRASSASRRGPDAGARSSTPLGEADFELRFAEAHNLANALCAIAIGVALGVALAGDGARAPRTYPSRACAAR